MSTADRHALAILALGWSGYCALHSLLAALRVKDWFARRYPALLPAYRLAYNALAVLLLAPIGWLIAVYPGPPLWAWSGAAAFLADALAWLAACAFVATLRYYDLREFIGLRQWESRRRSADDGAEGEALRLSPLHRYVRHPWYSLALVLIWTRDMNAAQLLSAVLVSAYFVIGARLEDARLSIDHGAAYRYYRKRVAALFPLPWKTLSARDAARLETMARRHAARRERD